MPTLNLVGQNESDVKRKLEASLSTIRCKNYALQRDYGSFLTEFAKALFYHFIEGNKPLVSGLREAVTKEPGSIADFCCGSGKGTLRVAETFPEAEIYGFDIMPPSIAEAKRRAKENPRIHFKRRDVYNFEDGHDFDVVTFHEACGTLADKVMQYGTEHEAPVIGGRFCCYHTIPDETPTSKNAVINIYLKLAGRLYDFVRDRVAQNYVKPRDAVDRDLLSAFTRDQLGVTEDELKRIAATAVDSRLGSRFVDLNRVMKLIERKYAVDYDEANHIVIAIRKSSAR